MHKTKCYHITTIAKYKNQQLLGYQCTNCPKLTPINPQFQKRKGIKIKKKPYWEKLLQKLIK